MAVNKVDLTVSQLINDLNSGYTWFKKDDLGYGSIETKYGANPAQIMAIRKHPSLKDAETNITIFNIIDDTKNVTTNNTKESTTSRTTNEDRKPVVPVDSIQSEVGIDTSDATAEAADIFANL
jgi:hypothetical protein